MKSFGARSFSVLPLVALFAAACGPVTTEFAPGLLHRLEAASGRSLESPSERGRGIAAGETAPACFSQTLSGPALKQAVLDAERDFPADSRPAAGSWRNQIDLSRLGPAARAFFLGAGGEWVVNFRSEDFAGCTSPVCVLNRVYGKSDDADEGQLAYLFYLRTGYVLSAKNLIPSDGIKVQPSNPYIDFLFGRDELLALNVLAQDVPESILRLKALERLHRFPRGYYPPEWLTPNEVAQKLTSGATCGKAHYNSTGTRGFIVLTDSCLRNGVSWDTVDSGDLQAMVLHEMGHHRDAPSYDSAKGEWIYPHSGDPRWRSFSGWWLDSAKGPDGAIQTAWKSDPTKEGFVRAYAGTTPLEDFAESVSYYRYFPEEMGKFPGKAEYLKANVFGGRSYGRDGWLALAGSRASHAIQKFGPRFNSACTAQPLATLASLGIVPDEQGRIPAADASFSLSLPLEEPVKACLDHSATAVVRQELDRMRVHEPGGCAVLDASTEARVVASALSQSVSWMQAYFDADLETRKLTAEVQRFRSMLRDALDPREAYLRCREGEGPVDCYGRALEKAFEQVADEGGFRQSLTESLLGAELASLREFWPFEKAEAEFVASWTQLMERSKSMHARNAVKRWEECAKQPFARLTAEEQSVGDLQLFPFNGGSRYVDARLLNCLNEGANQRIVATRDRFFREVMGFEGSPDAPTSRFLMDRFLAPYWTEVWSAEVDKGRKAEEESRARLALSGVSKLRSLLLADLSWLQGLASLSAVEPACNERALSRLEGGTVAELASVPVTYQAFGDTERDWAARACGRIQAQPEVAALLQALRAEEARQAELRWKAALAKMEELTLAEAAVRAGTCLATYRSSSSSHTRARRDCLLIPWDGYVREALSKWKVIGFEPAILARENDAKTWAGTTRRASLQRLAIEAMESRR